MAVSCYYDQIIVREDETLHPNSLLITGYILSLHNIEFFPATRSSGNFVNFESEFTRITILVNLNYICMTGTICFIY